MIAIKTMNEMPRNCLACPAFVNCEDCEGYMNSCGVTNEYVGYIHDEPEIMIDKRPDNCPLIKIPDKNPKVTVRQVDARGGKVSEWVKNPNSEYAPPVCSECGHECAFAVDYIEAGQGTRPDIKSYLSNYCPNCGADMRGGKSE